MAGLLQFFPEKKAREKHLKVYWKQTQILHKNNWKICVLLVSIL